MNPFINRLKMLNVPLSRETPESLVQKFKAHGYKCTEEDILKEVPEICWQTAYWDETKSINDELSAQLIVLN